MDGEEEKDVDSEEGASDDDEVRMVSFACKNSQVYRASSIIVVGIPRSLRRRVRMTHWRSAGAAACTAGTSLSPSPARLATCCTTARSYRTLQTCKAPPAPRSRTPFASPTRAAQRAAPPTAAVWCPASSPPAVAAIARCAHLASRSATTSRRSMASSRVSAASAPSSPPAPAPPGSGSAGSTSTSAAP